MNTTISRNHPYWHVRKLVEENPSIRLIHLSYYKYRPQSLIDERTTFSINREIFLLTEEILKIIASVPSGHELAIHSEVKSFSGETLHIPMIDMATSEKAKIHDVSDVLKKFYPDSFSWFESGRSFHGYGSQFQTKEEWIAFLGILLLANPKDSFHLIDTRWIGHRLISGYSSLRWTKNTNHYLQTPTLIRNSLRLANFQF